MRRLFVAGGLSLALVSAALASPAMTSVPTQMRATPNSHGAIVQSIPANAEIDVTGCGKIWCSASWRDREGFVRASAISAGPDTPPLVNEEPPPPPPPPAVVFAPPLVVAPFGCCWGGYYWRHGW
jgi:uncharacterized protein YraI